MRIDHVLLASRDMDATAAHLLEAHGLGSAEGGSHPDWGTANRIIPAGDQYLEIIGVVDEARARESAFGQYLLSLTAGGDRLMGWCLRPDDFDATAARLGLDAVPGVRTRPDGVEVGWRLAGLPEAVAEPWLPFFIAWEDPRTHPSTMPVAQAASPTEISWVEVGGDDARLRAWLGDAAIPVRRGDDARVTAVALARPHGPVIIRV